MCCRTGSLSKLLSTTVAENEVYSVKEATCATLATGTQATSSLAPLAAFATFASYLPGRP